MAQKKTADVGQTWGQISLFTSPFRYKPLSQQKDWISVEEITYQYDSLSRLISVATTEPEWTLSFAYVRPKS